MNTVVAGVPASALGDTALETWSAAPAGQRVGALAELLRNGRVDAVDIGAALPRWPRLPSRRRLLRTLELCTSGAESFLEVIARERVFVGPAFRSLTGQHCIVVDGRSYRVDLWHAQTRTAIELDGCSFHSSAPAIAADRRRDADLASAGVLTLRFSYDDITRRAGWCRSITLRVLHERGLARQRSRAAA